MERPDDSSLINRIMMDNEYFEDYVVTNIIEEIVDLRLDKAIKEVGVCGCKRCRADMLAYALNHLPPKYVVSIKGDVYSRLSTYSNQKQAELTVAITEAVKTVGKNPSHPEGHPITENK